jgi:hypothetical protein
MRVLREPRPSIEHGTLRAFELSFSFKDKNAVRLRGPIYVAIITLDDKEPGIHTLTTPRTMRPMGPSWL